MLGILTIESQVVPQVGEIFQKLERRIELDDTKVQILLPILLAFAGGAMIYVVVQELIPESQTNEKKDLMALFTILGFLLMMIFDVALG